MPQDTYLAKLDDDNKRQRSPGNCENNCDGQRNKRIPNSADKPIPCILAETQIWIPNIQFNMLFFEYPADIPDQQKSNDDHKTEQMYCRNIWILQEEPVDNDVDHYTTDSKNGKLFIQPPKPHQLQWPEEESHISHLSA